MSHLPPRSYLVLTTFFFLAVISTSIWLLLAANGFQFLTGPFRIVKTGVITVRTHPTSGVQLAVNGQEVAANHWDMSNLTPGRYTLALNKEGFTTWQQTIDLKAGTAVYLHDIVLFYEKPLETLVTDDSLRRNYEAILAKPEKYQAGLQVLGGEVWADDELITRYSNSVDQALWYPDKKHILIVVDRQLRIIETSSIGRQDLVLYQIPDEVRSLRFAPIAGGQKLILEEDGKLKELTITEPYSLVSVPTF